MLRLNQVFYPRYPIGTLGVLFRCTQTLALTLALTLSTGDQDFPHRQGDARAAHLPPDEAQPSLCAHTPNPDPNPNPNPNPNPLSLTFARPGGRVRTGRVASSALSRARARARTLK